MIGRLSAERVTALFNRVQIHCLEQILRMLPAGQVTSILTSLRYSRIYAVLSGYRLSGWQTDEWQDEMLARLAPDVQSAIREDAVFMAQADMYGISPPRAVALLSDRLDKYGDMPAG